MGGTPCSVDDEHKVEVSCTVGGVAWVSSACVRVTVELIVFINSFLYAKTKFWSCSGSGLLVTIPFKGSNDVNHTFSV